MAEHLSKDFGNEHWCLEHMSESKLGKLIEEAMDEKFEGDVDDAMASMAKDEVDKELKLAFIRNYSPQFLPSIYSDVRERCRNKAFRTLFLKKHNDIYEEAHSIAVNKWKKSTDTKKEVSDFLIKELEVSGVYVSEKISEIFKTEFQNTIEKKFLLFKDQLPCEMRSYNAERKKWALEKIEKIKKNEEADKKILIKNAETQIEKIYEEYENEITDTPQLVKFVLYTCRD